MSDPWDRYTLDNPELWQISHDNVIKENEKLKAQLQAAQEKLAVAEKILGDMEYVLTNIWAIDWQKFHNEFLPKIQTFLTTSQVPGLVVVRREDLEEITNFYNFVRDDVLATFDQDKAYDRLKAALEGKEEGK